MGTFAAGQVVLVQFPFSDLSSVKLRPAVVLANADRSDWILCQITSNPYGDVRAIKLGASDLISGSLHRESFIRPAKLFTAHTSLITVTIGALKPHSLSEVRNAIVQIIQAG